MMTLYNGCLVPVVVLSLVGLLACGKADQPANSDAATPLHNKADAVPHDQGPRVETGIVDYSGQHQDLSLAGKIAYG